ncbi:MAG: hypothetical protein IPN10_02680 [Saprospiraceae bacterium]|nr:hypothetical protein [Saprospiraceae bacterium]
MGEVREVYVTGAFARGIDDKIIDLVFVGNINTVYLAELISKVEKHISRRIRYIVFQENEVNDTEWNQSHENALLLWSNE